MIFFIILYLSYINAYYQQNDMYVVSSYQGASFCSNLNSCKQQFDTYMNKYDFVRFDPFPQYYFTPITGDWLDINDQDIVFNSISYGINASTGEFYKLLWTNYTGIRFTYHLYVQTMYFKSPAPRHFRICKYIC